MFESSQARVLACALVLGCASMLQSPRAFADIYGYIDDEGVTHFAAEPLDGRYTLFFRDGADAAAQGHPAAVGSDALMRTRLFKRVVDNPALPRYDALMRDVGRSEGIDPQLLKSVIAVESGFEPTAVSSKGAIGLMQLLPETAARYGVVADRKRTVAQKLMDPAINVRAGAHYLRDLMDLFADLPLALAAYNAGENAVRRFDNKIPPFPETREYVQTVQQFYVFYRPGPAFVEGRHHVLLGGGRHSMPATVTSEQPLEIPSNIIQSVPVQQIR